MIVTLIIAGAVIAAAGIGKYSLYLYDTGFAAGSEYRAGVERRNATFQMENGADIEETEGT